MTESAHLMTHLTPDQLTECIVEDATPPECEAHLRQCALCRQQLIVERDLFLTSIANFSSASLAWSESRPRIGTLVSASSFSVFGFVPFASSLAVVALLAVALPVWHHDRASLTPRNQSFASVADDSTAQIEQDNKLLQSVNVALADSEPSPFSEYHLSGPGRGTLNNQAESRYP